MAQGKASSFFKKLLVAGALVVTGACVWAFLSNDIKGAATSAQQSVQSQVANGLNKLEKQVRP